MRAGIFRRAAAACAAASASVLLIGTAITAQAATPGWRQVFSKHYGAAANYSGYGVVVATAGNNAWALGGTDRIGAADSPTGTPVAEHWNGRAWSGYAMPKGTADTISAASAPAANDVWAVTNLGGYILHWNGRTWSVAHHLAGTVNGMYPQLTGVVALSATNVWVFGSSDITLGWGTWHYNGKTWRQWGGDAVDIASASAVSAANIWAIGGVSSPHSAIVHYTGTWKTVSAPALSGLLFQSIQAFSAANVWVSALSLSNGQPWLLHYNGRSWAKFKVPWPVSFVPDGGFTSDGRGGLWLSVTATTNQAYEVHRTAAGAWSRTRVSALLLGLAHIPGTASLWGAGAVYGRTGGKAVIWAYGAV